MTDELAVPAGERAKLPAAYPLGYEPVTTEYFGMRSAARQAAFFLPYLGAGLSLLDCGCGPGTITADLAEMVAPGEVLGIDIEPSQIQAARSHAAGRGLSNIRFEVADLYDLPVSPDYFDCIFLHGIVEHLHEPTRALREARRVLKPGGILGLRNGAVSANLVDPTGTGLQQLLDLYSQLCYRDGGDPEFGRSQVAALNEAGFMHIRASASYDCWTETPEVTQRSAKGLAAMLREGGLGSQAIALGLADRVWLERTASAIESWANNPAAFAAEAWCEAVAWKD
jgi:ubiquinone/menaquinone biosynthesis C-methylase UbiE